MKKIFGIGFLLGPVLLLAGCSASSTPSASAPPSTAAPATSKPSVPATTAPAAPAATPAAAAPAAAVAPAAASPVTAASPVAAGPGAPEKTSLKLIQGSTPDFAQTALYKSIQYMKERYGVTAEISSVSDTDTATRAVIAGSADIVVNSLYYTVNAAKSGIGLKTIMVDSQSVTYLYMGAPEIKTLNDLVGKTVAYGKPGDISSTVVLACTKMSGIDPNQIKFVSMGGTSARLSALLAGQVQATVAQLAESLSAQQKGALNVLADCGKLIGTFLQTGVSSSDQWLAANPNLAQMYVDSYIDALRWATEDKEGYIALSKQIVPEMDDGLRSQSYDALKGVNLFAVNGGFTPETITKFINIGIETGAIEAPIPDTWYTVKYVDNYLARKGKR